MPDMSWMTRSYKITVSRAKLFCFLGLTSLTIAFLIFLMMMLILVQLHGEHTLEVAQELLLTHPNCQLCFDVSSKNTIACRLGIGNKKRSSVSAKPSQGTSIREEVAAAGCLWCANCT